MKILNINIIDTKLLIDNNLVTINSVYKSNYSFYYFNIENYDSTIIEFKLIYFNNFILYLHYFIANNIKFTIGFNLYKKLFYIIIINQIIKKTNNFNFIYNYFINDSQIEVTDKLIVDNIIGHGSFGKIHDYNHNSVIKISFINYGLNEFINYLKLFYNINKFIKYT